MKYECGCKCKMSEDDNEEAKKQRNKSEEQKEGWIRAFLTGFTTCSNLK